MDKPWTLGRIALAGSLLIGWVWGTMLIVAMMNGRESLVLSDVFSSVCLLIFSVLGVLTGGKSWKDFALLKWGQNVTRTSKTVETNIAVPADKPADPPNVSTL
jgi:hypothetical protein